MKRKPATVHGVLALDKPLGPTSRNALDQAGRLLGERRAGHAGTLDPAATGLLCLCFGEATKAVTWLMSAPKTYEATLAFGRQTTTDDAQGETVRTAPVPDELRQRATLWLRSQIGACEQVPPAVSALQREGVRDHDRVRRGELIERPPRSVKVYISLATMSVSAPMLRA
ncbi:MAG: hypothetical protein HYZ27_02290 [Deltaproteobacteria bacterium]|nr:hypothetical protein [Deltaproteobacteria bacterium]